MSLTTATDPALDPIVNAESDARAAKLAQEAVEKGRAELFCGLVASALEDPGLGATARSRLQAAAEHLADEAPSYELAARLWLHAGRHYVNFVGSRACECFARSFAYVPESADEAIAGLQQVVRDGGPRVADDASRWMHGLVHDGLFPRADYQRFERAITDARPRTEKDLLRAELVQISNPAVARARLELLLAEGRIAQLRALLGDLWGEPECGSPEGTRLAIVLEVFEELLPPGPDRGEVRYARAVYFSHTEGSEITLRACIGVLGDLPGDPRAHALFREVFDNEDTTPERDFFERCLDEFRIEGADYFSLIAQIEARNMREEKSN